MPQNPLKNLTLKVEGKKARKEQKKRRELPGSTASEPAAEKPAKAAKAGKGKGKGKTKGEPAAAASGGDDDAGEAGNGDAPQGEVAGE